jgi:uncharacterized protein with HEPN domain
MKERKYRDYLNDIFQAITDVASFIEGMSYKEFLRDRKTVNAVVKIRAAVRMPKYHKLFLAINFLYSS